MLGNLLSRLLGRTTADQLTRTIFPSPEFHTTILKTNTAWRNQCIAQPVFLKNTRIHILGSSLINVPPAGEVRRVLPDLHSTVGWVVVDEANENARWLNRYASIVRRCPSGSGADSHDHELFLRGVRTWSERLRNEMQDEGVPDEWIEALVCTGLRPGWDAVEAVEVGLEMGVPVEFVGMGVAEEVQRVQVYLAQRGVEAAVEEEMGNVVGKSHIHAELRKLFEGVGVAAADIGKIDTGSPLADSRLQNLVLDPANLARYNAIVSQHLKAGARNGGQTASRDRYLESEARNYVRCERIAESLQDVCEEFENGGLADGAVHPGEDRVVLAVIDRNCVDGVRKMVAALSS